MKRLLKTTISMVLAAVLLAVSVPLSAAAAGFTDVKSDSWYAESVQWASSSGVTSGTSATTFSPDTPCTRAQAVTFLWRAAGSPAPKSTANPFTDVKPGQYYTNAVLWAVENNITSGTSRTTFSPDTVCSRAQIVTFLHRAAGLPTQTSGDFFLDIPYGSYYFYPVLWAANNGITSGTSRRYFSPDDPCTRAQIVTFLYRASKGGWLEHGIVVDGVDLSGENVRQVRENLYYYSVGEDYTLYDRYGFAEILETVYDEFGTLFDYDPVAERPDPLLIKLTPNIDYCETNYLGQGYRIQVEEADNTWAFTSVFSPLYVYELSHELTHYFYWFVPKGHSYQMWNEEIIAETMALTMLRRLEGKVDHTDYSLSRYLNYFFLDGKYKSNEQALKSVVTPTMTAAEFQVLSAKVKQEWNPEVRYLYDTLLQYPDSDIRELLKLYDYYLPADYIDYDKWERNYTGTPGFIAAVSRIQPKITE